MENEFIQLLKPQNIFMTKERLGPPEDGGYVMPKYVYENCSALFTYGVGHETRFEEEFTSKYGKPVYMFDHTLGHEKWERGNIYFIPEGLGSGENCKEFINHYKELQISDGVFLKIDIEGGEYEYFKNTNISDLESTVIGLSLEVHWIDNHGNREDLVTILTRLQEHFILCHIHGNNWGDIWRYEGLEIPKVLELSFINKKYVERYEPDTQSYPIEGLDIPNNPKFKDYNLNFLYE